MKNTQVVKLRYDGKWTDIPEMGRQWTLLSDYFDADGQNRRGGSFSLAGLVEINVIPADKVKP